MKTFYVNVWFRRGALGGKPLLHLSRTYASAEEASTGQNVPPDAGWTLLDTLKVTEDGSQFALGLGSRMTVPTP